MIELNERLSEFSYGYGVTRAVERCLADIGIKTTPFLPSLIHEETLGFDVGFKKSGAAILLQFKLGQSLERFLRDDLSKPAPVLDRPFWRFFIDTSEPDGQFEILLNSQLNGADVYYVAPKFSDWTDYVEAFESDIVLESSLLISPNDIRQQLASKSIADGWHRIVYDETRAYVCSEPQSIPMRSRSNLAEQVSERIRVRKQPLAEVVAHIYAGLEDLSSTRRAVKGPDYERELTTAAPGILRRGETRRARLSDLLARARTPDDAKAAALGLEVWGLGTQLVLATEA